MSLDHSHRHLGARRQPHRGRHHDGHNNDLSPAARGTDNEMGRQRMHDLTVSLLALSVAGAGPACTSDGPSTGPTVP
ncbi:MAG: hypothetical protein ACLP7F_02045 [Acidimicrobiales bacterium]